MHVRERWHVTTNCLYSLWHWEANRLVKEGTGNNKKQFSSQAEACRTWFQFDTRTLIIASDVTRLFHIAFWLFVSTYPRSCGSQGSWFQMWRDVQKHLGILREDSEKKPPEMLRYFSLPRNQNANRVPSKCLHWCMGQNTLAANVWRIWQGTQRLGDVSTISQFALLQLSGCQNQTLPMAGSGLFNRVFTSKQHLSKALNRVSWTVFCWSTVTLSVLFSCNCLRKDHLHIYMQLLCFVPMIFTTFRWRFQAPSKRSPWWIGALASDFVISSAMCVFHAVIWFLFRCNFCFCSIF